MIQPAFEILNQRGTPMFFSDVYANIPTAGIVGRIFISTDTKEFYRDTGSTWELIGGPGSVTVTGSGTAGQVTYWNGASSITGSNNLFWDSANNRLGINNSAPLFSSDITGNARITGTTIISPVSTINTYSAFSTFNVINDGPASIAVDRFSNNGTSPHFNLRKSRGTTTAPLIVQTNDELGYVGFWGHDGTSYQRNGIILTQAFNVTGTTITPVMRFGLGNTAALNQYWITLHNTGNTVFGNIGLSDNGARVQIFGDAFIKGSGNTSATTALNIQNSTGNSFVRALNSEVLEIGTGNRFGFSSSSMQHVTSAGVIANFQLVAGSIAMQYSSISVGTTAYNSSNAFSDSFTRTSISASSFSSFATFNPTSGTNTFAGLNINSTINQTGTATGITFGVYIQPTLTAAADWRSIQWNNNTGWGIYGVGTSSNYFAGKTLIGTNNTTGGGIFQVSNTTGDDHLRVWGATSPSIRIDNAVSSATQRFVMGLATATNNFIQGSTAGDICISTASANAMLFGMWQTINASEVMRISTSNNLLVGTTVDSGNKFRLNGSIRIDGQTSGTAGGSSGQHLIIDCDGTIYKIALLNA